ncbi:hypothetical protein [Demequina lutea]|uniref:Uncharacterized protein n=1 Tax=Demequina lutea TaxID=431489 RepID=A0A7Y9ZCJ1_9MICO|nr:hypothetical protein [Demequina lutea]NYI42138.1 hypothetical protein [Demequina lutea]
MTEERDRNAFELAARLDRLRDSENAKAAVLIQGFARDAHAAGILPERLSARPYSGRSMMRTNITGWYIKRDHSVGISVDGHFYLLHAPGGIKERLRGVTLEPSPAPLEIGRGARDGESMPLTESLAKRLAAGNGGY